MPRERIEAVVKEWFPSFPTKEAATGGVLKEKVFLEILQSS